MNQNDLKRIHWVPELRAEEYPEDALSYLSRKHCESAIHLRIASSVPMVPGPYLENFARFKPPGSRHNVGDNPLAPVRESDAGDYFVNNNQHVAQLLKHAPNHFTGIGVYFDTSPSVMFHFDNRPLPARWLRIGHKYINYNEDPVKYYQLLAVELDKLPRQLTW